MPLLPSETLQLYDAMRAELAKESKTGERKQQWIAWSLVIGLNLMGFTCSFE